MTFRPLFQMTLALGCALACNVAVAQTVKVTPLGTHTGELCARDRAMIFEDPTGVRILYDVGQSVMGGTDPRLGTIHVVLLTHAHTDRSEEHTSELQSRLHPRMPSSA